MSETRLEIEDEVITRPRIISVIAIFYLILGIFYCLTLPATTYLLIINKSEKIILSLLGGIPIVLVGGFSIVSAIGTLKLKKWAIKCLMLLSILYILFGVFTITLGARLAKGMDIPYAFNAVIGIVSIYALWSLLRFNARSKLQRLSKN